MRFGNVLGSDGSVIPLFQRQIAAGQPLTVTHPEVRRYFMTIPEAVQLVLQATVLPDAAGRICMLEMGEPVRILYLAEQMIRLSGLTPYKDVPIVFTGLRPGEKLDEELTSEIEATMPTVVEKIRLVRTDDVDRRYARLRARADQHSARGGHRPRGTRSASSTRARVLGSSPREHRSLMSRCQLYGTGRGVADRAGSPHVQMLRRMVPLASAGRCGHRDDQRRPGVVIEAEIANAERSA